MRTNETAMGGFVKTLLVMVLVVAALGAIGAVGWSQTDLLNFIQASTEKARVEAELSRQQQIQELEMPYLEQQLAAQHQASIAQLQQEDRLRAAQTEAELARIEADGLAYEQQLAENQRVAMIENDQRMAEAQLWTYAEVFLTVAAGLALIGVTAIACSKALLRLVDRRVPLPQIKLQNAVDWNNPEYRRQRIIEARLREQLERENTAAAAPVVMHRRYSTLCTNGTRHAVLNGR